jgi:hypothetical protein
MLAQQNVLEREGETMAHDELGPLGFFQSLGIVLRKA